MEADSNAHNSGEGRPYRSHLHPACLACKRRKSRCKVTTDSRRVCIMCQAHDTECVFLRNAKTTNSPRNGSAAKARQGRLPRGSTGSSSREHRLLPGRPSASAYSPRTVSQPAVQPNSSHENQGRCQQGARISPTSHLEEPREDEGNINGGEPLSNLTGIIAEAGDSNGSHIVSPAVANDDDVLESYLSSFPGARRPSMVRASPPSSGRATTRPVLFNTVPKRPLGIPANQSVAASKRDLIEKFIEPGVDEIVDMFFRKANICFPVFDEASFRHAYTTHKEKISPALLCNLYSNSLVYWECSAKLRGRRCPDGRFIWNQATEALHSELFLSPGISTVMAIVLNVCGRPSTSIFGNGGMVGTAVALCNALGLNRDPSNWNISTLEKRFRIRIWWLVVVHDRWCSLAYGTPLQIHRAQYDVPFPTMNDLCSPDAELSQMEAASIFVAFTTLTENVLSRYLEHVYSVSKAAPSAPELSATDLDLLLSEWEESLSDDIRRLALRGTQVDSPGAANFRLAYLAVKLLLRRLQVDLDRVVLPEEAASATISNSTSTMSPFYIQAQRAAEEIVHLVQELDEPHIRGFWIPVNAFSITSATTLLLRSALRTRSPNASAPLRMARDMVNTLRAHRENFAWDLADNCLAHRGDLVEKISSVQESSETLTSPAFPEFHDRFWDMDASVGDELFSGFPGLADAMESQFQVHY